MPCGGTGERYRMIPGRVATLLPFDEKWTDLVRRWVNQPEVRCGTGTEGPVSDVEHRKWHEALLLDRSQRVYVIGRGAGADATPVGLIGLKHLNWRSRSAELWIYIGETGARRGGLAEDATRLLLDFGFNTLNLHRISLVVRQTNSAAVALYKKAGFVHEGTAREQMFFEGAYVDVLCFAMLEHEFRERAARP